MKALQFLQMLLFEIYFRYYFFVFSKDMSAVWASVTPLVY